MPLRPPRQLAPNPFLPPHGPRAVSEELLRALDPTLEEEIRRLGESLIPAPPPYGWRRSLAAGLAEPIETSGIYGGRGQSFAAGLRAGLAGTMRGRAAHEEAVRQLPGQRSQAGAALAGILEQIRSKRAAEARTAELHPFEVAQARERPGLIQAQTEEASARVANLLRPPSPQLEDYRDMILILPSGERRQVRTTVNQTTGQRVIVGPRGLEPIPAGATLTDIPSPLTSGQMLTIRPPGAKVPTSAIARPTTEGGFEFVGPGGEVYSQADVLRTQTERLYTPEEITARNALTQQIQQLTKEIMDARLKALQEGRPLTPNEISSQVTALANIIDRRMLAPPELQPLIDMALALVGDVLKRGAQQITQTPELGLPTINERGEVVDSSGTLIVPAR